MQIYAKINVSIEWTAALTHPKQSLINCMQIVFLCE